MAIFCPVQLGLIVVAATLLTSCLSAPASTDPWWYHPCNADPLRIRHGRSTTDHLLDVKRALRIFVSKLNLSIKAINVLYKSDKTKSATPRGKFKWLKLKKFLRIMAKSPDKTLPEFYNALHYFAGTLDVLSNIPVKTDQRFKESDRDSIYLNITYQMRSLLCEVQDTFKANNEKVPSGIPYKKIKNIKDQLPKTFDVTRAHLFDLNFLKKTKNFFSRSQKIFNRKKTKKVKKQTKKTSVVKHKRTLLVNVRSQEASKIL